nr:MAG TPA: hypothetical protein [Caudoviricetes sp.]
MISSCNIGRQSFITSERISNIRTMTTTRAIPRHYCSFF